MNSSPAKLPSEPASSPETSSSPTGQTQPSETPAVVEPASPSFLGKLVRDHHLQGFVAGTVLATLPCGYIVWDAIKNFRSATNQIIDAAEKREDDLREECTKKLNRCADNLDTVTDSLNNSTDALRALRKNRDELSGDLKVCQQGQQNLYSFIDRMGRMVAKSSSSAEESSRSAGEAVASSQETNSKVIDTSCLEIKQALDQQLALAKQTKPSLALCDTFPRITMKPSSSAVTRCKDTVYGAAINTTAQAITEKINSLTVLCPIR